MADRVGETCAYRAGSPAGGGTGTDPRAPASLPWSPPWCWWPAAARLNGVSGYCIGCQVYPFIPRLRPGRQGLVPAGADKEV